MAYHEYATATGTTTHRHYNGIRLGASYEDVLDQQQRLRDMAETELITLLETIGESAYQAWLDPYPDNVSWQELYNAAHQALGQIENGECTCILPEHSCTICREKYRLMRIKVGIDPDEIPYRRN